MTNENNPAAVLLDAVFTPLGDYAPQKRWVVIDFKNAQDEDRNLNTYLYCNHFFTDEMIVQALSAQIASEGGRLCSLCEVIEDGGKQWGRCIYSVPGYLEETMKERGLPIPEDMIACANAAGFHPINWDELVKSWEGHA